MKWQHFNISLEILKYQVEIISTREHGMTEAELFLNKYKAPRHHRILWVCNKKKLPRNSIKLQ